MAQLETWVNCYLGDLVKVQYIDGNVFSMDNMGNLVGVHVFDKDGNPVELTGSVTAHAIRANGSTVATTGQKSGNDAWVVLPQACYYSPGPLAIVIKLTYQNTITTLACVVANVYESVTGTIVDPGTIISSIETLISSINTAVASIPADYSALWTSLAPAFSTSANYVAGQYVTNNGGVYRFLVNHTAGDWVSSEVSAVKLGNEIASLKSAIDVKTDCNLPAGYKSANYENSSGSRRIKWLNDYLNIYNRFSAGSISASELPTSNASLSPGTTTTVNISNKDKAILRVHFVSTQNTDSSSLLYLRYYKDNFTQYKELSLELVGSEGCVSFDLINEAYKNAFSVEEYPYVFIRKISWPAHTATGTEYLSIDIYGIYTEPKKYIDSSSLGDNPFRFKPAYAHLFINTVNDTEQDTYVPSQSEYDIEIAKRLGFDVIEVNTHVLSDGEYICLHGDNNKFGKEFVAASGSTYTDQQIQDTTMTTVDLAWVRQNVRYKAKYPTRRTSPLTLSEFLYACRKNHVIPLINWKSIDQVGIANKIMGVDNYIFYDANSQTRAISKSFFVTWRNFTTKADILQWVKNYGSPCMVGIANYNNFTLTEWKEIVEDVHAIGGLLAFADGYVTPTQAQDLWDVGFDASGSLYAVNPFNDGNVITADAGFDDFTITNGVYSDGKVSLTQNGTIVPASQIMGAEFLTASLLDVTFSGSISVNMGRFITHDNATFTSTDTKTIHLSTYAMNSIPTFEIMAGTGGAIIQNVVFRVAKR